MTQGTVKFDLFLLETNKLSEVLEVDPKLSSTKKDVNKDKIPIPHRFPHQQVCTVVSYKRINSKKGAGESWKPELDIFVKQNADPAGMISVQPGERIWREWNRQQARRGAPKQAECTL